MRRSIWGYPAQAPRETELWQARTVLIRYDVRDPVSGSYRRRLGRDQRAIMRQLLRSPGDGDELDTFHRLHDFISFPFGRLRQLGAVLFLYFATVQNPGADRSVLIIGCGSPSKSEIGFQFFLAKEGGRENGENFTQRPQRKGLKLASSLPASS